MNKQQREKQSERMKKRWAVPGAWEKVFKNRSKNKSWKASRKRCAIIAAKALHKNHKEAYEEGQKQHRKTIRKMLKDQGYKAYRAAICRDICKDPERNRKVSEGNKKAYASGKREPAMGSGYIHCKKGWIKTVKGQSNIYYRSGWEKAFIEILDSSRIVRKFKAHPLIIPYIFEGEQHTYFPDYYVKLKDDRKFIVELKGQLKPNDKAKFKAAEKFCKRKGYTFVVIHEKPIGKVSTMIQ